MTTSPILCSGNDLASVCADIRARGGLVTSLTTGVGGNAGYRVNYFDGGCTAVISVGPGREARNVESAPRTPEMGSNPMPTAISLPVARGDTGGSKPMVADGHGSDYISLHLSERVGPHPAVLTNLGNGVPVRRGEDQGENKTCSSHPAEPETSPALPAIVISEDRPGGAENADLGRRDDLSIEDRMAALQERLRAGGKLKCIKPSTLIQHARSPYKDD